jgi:hypothetical protein
MYGLQTPVTRTVQLANTSWFAVRKRRFQRPPTRLKQPPSPRALSHDRRPRRPGGGNVKIDLVLYISASSEKSLKAARAIDEVLKQYDTSQVNFAIRDLSNAPTAADEDSVVFTPTLVKRGPGPRTWIVGNLEHPELLMDLLEVSGVERKK